MKLRRHILSALLLLAVFFSLSPARAAHAQSEPAASTSGEKPEAADANDQFRHAPKVEAIARIFHVSTETAAQIFEDLNSGILIAVILFFLLKMLPKALRGRTAAIQKQLVEARSATEIANERLSAVEAKLARIGEDIEAVRQQSERESQADEQRIKQSLEEERQRIVKAAEQEIESAGAAAQRELKRFAADLAIDKAAQKISLGVESDKALVARFGKELVGFDKGGRN